MPQIPVTHYKDEDAASTQSVLEQELNKEVAASIPPPQKTELKVIPVTKVESKKQTNAANIVNAFRQKMANNTTSIELPSVGKTIEVKEIDSATQKDLSRVAMENDSRSDIMYCAMLSMINKLVTDKSFDIRDYTEFERIAITLNLQQASKMNPEIKFTCHKCHKENVYKLDTAKLLKSFNKTYRADQAFEVEVGSRKFTFVVGWPKVSCVENFFKNYYKKYENGSKSAKSATDNMSQIEYITMFIKSITVEEISDPDDKMTANLEEMTYPERVQIIDCMPQSILFNDDTGIISKVIESFVTPMNDSFKYRDCEFCGAEQTGAMATVSDFMGM